MRKILFIAMLAICSIVHGNNNSMTVKRFFNAKILTDISTYSTELWIKDGKVITAQNEADENIDMHGKLIAPGYIDIQINGAFGCDFARNPEELEKVAGKLLQYGVTAFCPTLVSSSPEQYQKAIPLLQPQSFGHRGAEVLGVHLEGPFFANKYKGAHQPEFILSSYDFPLEHIYGDLNGVKIVTLAPEIENGLKLVEDLTQRGIIVAAGHSAAGYIAIQKAIEAGVSYATHLFNAMPSFHHRDPGIVGAALVNPKIPYSLIVDGVHLAPDTVKLCWQCNADGLVLISDATEALGLPEGHYKLGMQDIEVYDDQIYLSGTRTLAGSNLNMSKAVRLLKEYTGCTNEEALLSASLKPSKLVGVYPRKGHLGEGADADFIVLSDDLNVDATYVGGERAFYTLFK